MARVLCMAKMSELASRRPRRSPKPVEPRPKWHKPPLDILPRNDPRTPISSNVSSLGWRPLLLGWRPLLIVLGSFPSSELERFKVRKWSFEWEPCEDREWSRWPEC